MRFLGCCLVVALVLVSGFVLQTAASELYSSPSGQEQTQENTSSESSNAQNQEEAGQEDAGQNDANQGIQDGESNEELANDEEGKQDDAAESSAVDNRPPPKPPWISDHAGILTILLAICAFFFFLEKELKIGLFKYVPPLMFIYLIPVLLSNFSFIPTESPVYDSIRSLVLPMMLVLLLVKVDVGSAVRVMGKGVIVMLVGTLGIVLGAPIGYLCVKGWLDSETWKAFGTLAGSWIGGTGNMAGVAEMIEVDDKSSQYGLAVLADSTIYIIWLPILLLSKNFAGWFSRFASVSEDRVSKMEAAAEVIKTEEKPPAFYHLLYLLFLALAVTWLADLLSKVLPEIKPYVSASTWKILLVTTAGIALSFTPARKIPGSYQLAMAFVYLFVARMGASANLAGVEQEAIPFLIGALIWIFFHGFFCVLAALLLRVDIHTLAIASAANVGGAASAPVVAAHHNEKLVPASILMAMIGYAVGNYAAYIAAMLCRLVSTI